MKNILSILLVVGSITLSNAKPKYPETVELLKAMQMDKQQARSIDSIMNQQFTAMPDLKLVEKEYKKLLQETVGWEAIKDEITALWEEKFTQPEIAELTKFYKSPIGAKALLVMPEILGRSMTMGTQRMQARSSELLRIQALLIDRKKAAKPAAKPPK